MKRFILSGFHASRAASASSTMFFTSVCPLVSTIASPKHPQSSTGSAMYIHTVRHVITTITPSTIFVTSRLLMANSNSTPNTNSIVDRAIAMPSSTQSAIIPPMPSASR